MDQPGKVVNPARGQLNREHNISLSPCVLENLVSRDGFSRPVPRQPAHLHTQAESGVRVCLCVYVLFPFILDIKFVGRTSRGHTGGRSHRISHPPSFCGACLNFSREKDSAVTFPRRP